MPSIETDADQTSSPNESASELDRRTHRESPIAVVDNSDGDLMSETAVQFNLSEKAVWELREFWEERGLIKKKNPFQIPGEVPDWMTKFIKMLDWIWRHPYLAGIFVILYIWGVPELDDIIDNQTPAEFAKKYLKGEKPKEALNKMISEAQEKFGTKPRNGQRSEESKNLMREKRIEYIQTKQQARA